MPPDPEYPRDIQLTITNPKSWRRSCVLEGEWIKLLIRRAYLESGSTREFAGVSFLFTSKRVMMHYNKKFREKNTSTNVLSFPLRGSESSSGEKKLPLGDIILAYETILSESYFYKIPFQNHLAHLIVHGFLHLLGFTHDKKDDALQMQTLEKRILSHLGVQAPIFQ